MLHVAVSSLKNHGRFSCTVPVQEDVLLSCFSSPMGLDMNYFSSSLFLFWLVLFGFHRWLLIFHT